MEITSINKPVLAQKEESSDNSLCKRASVAAKPITTLLEPFQLDDLHTHISTVLSFRPGINWIIPEDGFTLPSNPPERPFKCDADVSQAYLRAYLDYFVNVRNCNDINNSDMKYEQVFRIGGTTSGTILKHILSFSWTLLDLGTTDEMENLSAGVTVEDLMIVVMKLIRIFSRIDELASSVGEKSGIKLILRTMQRYPFCVQLQINCSACLANLASTKANLTAMLEEGCIKLVLENMNKFMNIPDVQAEICATIANLAVHDANARYIIDQGGCVLIIKAMRIHINQIDFQIQAFHALASLGKFGKEILDREHFMHAATKCLLAHSGNLDLISAAYHSIGSLANAGISIGSYKFELISGIFDSMKRFKDNCVFQVTACFALAHIFFNHRDPEQDDLAVAKKEGIQCILGIMKTFSDQESLQTTALFALGSIVMKSELHRNTVLESDGISIILNSMSRKYTSTPALDNDGLLIAEAAFEDELEAEIAPQAAEPVLFSRTNARVKCSKPLLLQLFGSVSLLNLAETEKCRDAIIEQGGIHAIFEASKKVHDQADLWFIVYYIFSKFTRCGEERIVYMKPRGFPTLHEIAKQSIADSWNFNKINNVNGNADSAITLHPSEFTIPHIEEPSTSPSSYELPEATYRELLSLHLRELRLAEHIINSFQSAKTCISCKKSCFDTYIRKYEVTRARNSILYALCSQQCAQADEKFSTRTLFRYTGQQDID